MSLFRVHGYISPGQGASQDGDLIIESPDGQVDTLQHIRTSDPIEAFEHGVKLGFVPLGVINDALAQAGASESEAIRFWHATAGLRAERRAVIQVALQGWATIRGWERLTAILKGPVA